MKCHFLSIKFIPVFFQIGYIDHYERRLKKNKKPMSLKMQMKMIIRLFVDILKTAWEVVENCYTRDPKKTGKSLMLG